MGYLTSQYQKKSLDARGRCPGTESMMGQVTTETEASCVSEDTSECYHVSWSQQLSRSLMLGVTLGGLCRFLASSLWCGLLGHQWAELEAQGAAPAFLVTASQAPPELQARGLDRDSALIWGGGATQQPPAQALPGHSPAVAAPPWVQVIWGAACVADLLASLSSKSLQQPIPRTESQRNQKAHVPITRASCLCPEAQGLRWEVWVRSPMRPHSAPQLSCPGTGSCSASSLSPHSGHGSWLLIQPCPVTTSEDRRPHSLGLKH